jgi:biuret amidohydrolase
MNRDSKVRVSRRQFVTASGVLGIAGAVCCRLDSAEASRIPAQADLDYDSMPRLPGHEAVTLVPAKTALLVIDLQRYFVHPDHPFGQTLEKTSPGCTAAYFTRVTDVVIPSCQKLQAAFRAAHATIIYTAFGSIREDGLDMPRWAREDNAWSQSVVGKPMYPFAKHPSWQVDDSLAPAPEEMVLAKTSSGPLNSTKLDQTLRTLGIDSLVVTGVVTDVCVTQTAREFADRDFKVVIVADACATIFEQRHHAALQTFAGVFGTVRTTNSVIAMLSG